VGNTFQVATTLLERKLAAIWSDVLRTEHIGVTDNFFESGGNSIKAIQIISRIHKELSVKVGLRYMFSNPCVRDLAQVISGMSADAHEKIMIVLQQEFYDVSNAQKQLWLLDQANPDLIAYNMSLPFIFRGSLNIKALQTALRWLVERHEILRTTFITIKGEPKQKIHEAAAQLTTCEIVRGTFTDEVIEKEIDKEIKKPFDLKTGPLIRAKLLCVEQDHFIFLITMHHIITDGWSITVLLQELLDLYTGANENGKNPLPPLKIQYKDYVYWQNKKAERPEWKEHQRYWLAQFQEEVTPLNMATDYPRGGRRTYNGNSINAVLGRDILKQLTTLNRKQGTSLFMQLLTATNALFYRYTAQNDIVLGSPVAGRSDEYLESQIGMYINTLPLRTKLEVGETLQTLLLKVKESTLNAYEHEEYPFDMLLNDLQLKKTMNRSALFDVIVALQNMEKLKEPKATSSSLIVENYQKDNVVSAFDMMITSMEGTDGLYVTLTYNTNLYNESTMQVFVKRLLFVLETLAGKPDCKIEDLNFLDDTLEIAAASELDWLFGHSY
jgi:hypothetical protein